MMRPRMRTLLLGSLVLVTAGGLAFHFWSREHMRRMSGLENIEGIWCSNCHGRANQDLPWLARRPNHPTPAGLAVSPDGTLLYVACSGTDEVKALDTITGEIKASTLASGRPFGLALDAEGHRLLVTCRDSGRLLSLDARSLEEKASVAVGMDPVAVEVVRRTEAARIVVANARSDDISIMDGSSFLEIARLAAGRQPYSISASADGARLLIANRLSRSSSPDAVPHSEATVVDPWGVRVMQRLPLESAHLSEGAAFLPGNRLALVPLVMVKNLVPITQVAGGWVMTSGLALLDLARRTVVRLPLDEANACFADPSDVVVDARTRRAFVASGGGNVVTVIDIERLERWVQAATAEARERAPRDLQLAPEYVCARIPTEANPRHLALSPDGRTLFVAEHRNDTILVIDTETLAFKARFRLAGNQPEDPVWRGARLFASARTSFQGQFSCRSCHPDGHVDGLTYDFDIDGLGRNILDNRSLRGVALTPPFKWNGKNPSLKAQCGVRFAKVLTRTNPIDGGDLDDLVAFIESLPPIPPAEGLDVDAVERGQHLFFAKRAPDGSAIPRAQRCSTCHPPPFYTNGVRVAVSKRAPTDTVESFDVPHLIGIGASAPYLHDGRAGTLEEIWTVHNPTDTHGITNSYSKHDMNDLVEFLKSL